MKPRYKDKVILKPLLASKGYLYQCLYKNKVSKNLLVHRMVAQAFLENPDSKDQVNHIDANKKNNNVENLEWCTLKENIEHAFKFGLGRVGELNGMSKFNNDEIRLMRKRYKPKDMLNGGNALAKEYKVNRGTIQAILSRKTYKNI